MNSTSTWYERVPKVELHLHLEGAIPQEALWQLIQKYGGDPAVPDMEALQQKFQYRDFPHFIETWVWKNQFLREYDDFTLIAEAVAQNLARQNVKYAEMFYSPLPFLPHGLETRKLTEAICTGLSSAYANRNCADSWIFHATAEWQMPKKTSVRSRS